MTQNKEKCFKIEIHSFDKELLLHLFEKKEVKEGDRFDGKGFELLYDRTFSRKVVHFPQILHFILVLTSEEGHRNAASWLSSRLKKKQVERLIINSRDASFEKLAMEAAFRC